MSALSHSTLVDVHDFPCWKKGAFVGDTRIVSSLVYNNTSFERSLVAVTVSAQNLLLLVLRSFFLSFGEVQFL